MQQKCSAQYQPNKNTICCSSTTKFYYYLVSKLNLKFVAQQQLQKNNFARSAFLIINLGCPGHMHYPKTEWYINCIVLFWIMTIMLVTPITCIYHTLGCTFGTLFQYLALQYSNIIIVLMLHPSWELLQAPQWSNKFHLKKLRQL